MNTDIAELIATPAVREYLLKALGNAYKRGERMDVLPTMREVDVVLGQIGRIAEQGRITHLKQCIEESATQVRAARQEA